MEKFIDIKAIRAVIEERKRLAGEGDLNVLSHLGALEEYLDTVSLEDCVVFCPHIDYGLDGETGEDGTAAILEMYENTMPFTVRWLSENVKLSDPRFEDENVRLWIEDETAEVGGDCGCIDIIYHSQVFWTLSKGLSYKEWLATVDNTFRNDVWIPSVKTIGDFKRLFRVAAGFDLPLKRKTENKETKE